MLDTGYGGTADTKPKAWLDTGCGGTADTMHGVAGYDDQNICIFLTHYSGGLAYFCNS